MLESDGIWNPWISSKAPHRQRREPPSANVSARTHAIHPKAERFEPREFMIGEIGVAAQPEALRHEPEVLQHHALLGRHEFCNELLDLPHGCDPAPVRIVFKMPSATAREFADASREEMIALVENEGACRLVQYFEQPVYVHEGEVIHRKKVRCARRIGRPAVRVDVEKGLGGNAGATGLGFYPGATGQLGERASFSQLKAFTEHTAGQFARPTDEGR